MNRHCTTTGFLTTALILVSCSGTGTNTGIRHASAPAEPAATMHMEILQEEGGGAARIGIVIRNPQHLPIQSVRSWVQFPSATLLVEDLTLEDERFSLEAPGEHAIDPAAGFIMIGHAAPRPVTDEEVRIASFRVRKRQQGEVILSFYDWLPGGDGHSAVLSVMDGVARNILELPSSLPLS